MLRVYDICAMHFAIVNGPNLNLLGEREPDIYGSRTFSDVLDELKSAFADVEISYFQSNGEGELVNIIQDLRKKCDGIILNAAAYSHTSIAIADAVAAVEIPVVGVHISNIYRREEERHTDLLAKYCTGYLFGLGIKGYELALRFLIDLNQEDR